jgi:hypothetical protein
MEFPLEQCFLVAIEPESAALSALKIRYPDLEKSELTVVGEASPAYLDRLDVKDGQILCVRVALT